MAWRSFALVSMRASSSSSTRRSVARPRRKSNIMPCQSSFTLLEA
jgi:hypothetical protein